MKIRARSLRTNFALIVLAAILVVPISSCRKGGLPSGAPKNEAAKVKIGKNDIRIAYDGGDIFKGEIGAGAGGFAASVNAYRSGEAVDQVVLLTPRDKAGKVRLEGTVAAGPESFPCEADRRDRGLVMVRHVVRA